MRDLAKDMQKIKKKTKGHKSAFGSSSSSTWGNKAAKLCAKMKTKPKSLSQHVGQSDALFLFHRGEIISAANLGDIPAFTPNIDPSSGLIIKGKGGTRAVQARDVQAMVGKPVNHLSRALKFKSLFTALYSIIEEDIRQDYKMLYCVQEEKQEGKIEKEKTYRRSQDTAHRTRNGAASMFWLHLAKYKTHETVVIYFSQFIFFYTSTQVTTPRRTTARLAAGACSSWPSSSRNSGCG